MSNHYYSAKPGSSHENRHVEAELRGNLLSFQTDAGVFSKKGIDFGSRLLIETVDLSHVNRLLDLGCGYGPVGIALAKADSSLHVTMVDINERAIKLAEENASRNHVKAQVEIEISDGFERLKGQKFDVILCNPPIRVGKAFIFNLFAESKNYLSESGSLWIVIRKQQGATTAKAELERLFTSVEQVTQKKGYCILAAR